MGCMRSSNWADGLNFHFRIRVQIIATPATQEAITIIIVIVVRLVVEVAEEAWVVLVASGAGVLVTVS